MLKFHDAYFKLNTTPLIFAKGLNYMRFSYYFTFSIVAVFSLFISACSEESKPEPKNAYEKAVYNPQRQDSDVAQDKSRKPAEVLALTGLGEGMIAADIYAGSGYYSELMSYLVGSNGKVYLHNKAKNAEKASEKLANNRLPNVKPLVGDITDFKLPEPVDFLLVSKVFHDLYVSEDAESNVDQFFSQLKKFVKSGGKVLIIDHSATDGSGISLTERTHRIDPAYVISAFKSHGFELSARSDVLSNTEDQKEVNIWEPSVFKKTDKFL